MEVDEYSNPQPLQRPPRPATRARGGTYVDMGLAAEKRGRADTVDPFCCSVGNSPTRVARANTFCKVVGARPIEAAHLFAYEPAPGGKLRKVKGGG